MKQQRPVETVEEFKLRIAAIIRAKPEQIPGPPRPLKRATNRKQNVERLLARCASWPYRCGLYTSSQNRSVRFGNAQDYFGIGKVPIPCSRVFQVFDGSFDSPYAMAGWFNCRRDLDRLYLVCSTTRDSFTAQESIFETLTLCVRGRVLSILLCISALHRNERILVLTRAS